MCALSSSNAPGIVSSQWSAHVTVATVIEQRNKYLLVLENDQGRQVYNQPAGHWEENETLFEAAQRETLEETGCRIKLTGFIGNYIYQPAADSDTYHRSAFSAELIEQTDLTLDPDIIETVWLSYEEILEQKDNLRSPLVLKTIEDFRDGQLYPLEVIKHVS